MDLSLLQIFIAVANEKSISLGAKSLNFSQSNVTLRVKQLEKVLGYKLFHRIPQGVKLTNEGEKLYFYANDLIKQYTNMMQNMKNLNYQEVLKVGTSQANASIRLLDFIEKITKKYPNMQLELSTKGTPDVIEDLLLYKTDIAFVTGEPNHSDLVVLNSFDDDLYLAEPKCVPCKNVLLGYRANSTHFNFLLSYEKQNNNNNFKINIIENYEVILGCVKKGIGKAYLSKKIIDKYGYANDLRLSKIYLNNTKELKTMLICRKNYMPMISGYLKRMKG